MVAFAAPAEADKPWEIGASFETHRMFIRNDLGGSANNKNLNYLYLYGRYEPTKNDALEIRSYFYQRFLADDGETGIRTDDVSLYYAHYIDLAEQWRARLYATATVPSSFTSMKMSLYSAPRLGGAVTWQRGPWTVQLIEYGEAYIVKYREMEGGNPNPKFHWGSILDAEYALPTPVVPVTVGVSAAMHRYWYYEVAHAQAADQPFYGAVQDPQFPTQPVQGSYGYQFFARAELPKMAGVQSDFTLAYGQGDSTLGYTSVLHDGLAHYYAFWRTNSQVYAALSLTY